MTEPMPAPKPKVEMWAIVEVMGHIRVAGKVTEECIAGVNMLRVDVPAATKHVREYGATGYVNKAIPLPGYTRYFGGAALFSITPCTEEIARAAAGDNSSEPPIALAMLNAPASETTGTDDDDEDELPWTHSPESHADQTDLERAASEGMPEHDRE